MGTAASLARLWLTTALDVIWAKKGKVSPYSITEHRVPELIPVLGSQPAGDVSQKTRCHYFPPGMQLPPQPLRGLLPTLLLGEQRHSSHHSFIPSHVMFHIPLADIFDGIITFLVISSLPGLPPEFTTTHSSVTVTVLNRCCISFSGQVSKQ